MRARARVCFFEGVCCQGLAACSPAATATPRGSLEGSSVSNAHPFSTSAPPPRPPHFARLRIMRFIRTLRRRPGYDPNTRHVVYGQDADLLLLALLCHEPHFVVMREWFDQVIWGR